MTSGFTPSIMIPQKRGLGNYNYLLQDDNTMCSDYGFVSTFEKKQPKNDLKYYFQIATFSYNNKDYMVRKFLITDMFTIKCITKHTATRDEIRQFIKNNPPNMYRLIPVYDLNTAGFPSQTDLLTLSSEMLNSTVARPY